MSSDNARSAFGNGEDDEEDENECHIKTGKDSESSTSGESSFLKE